MFDQDGRPVDRAEATEGDGHVPYRDRRAVGGRSIGPFADHRRRRGGERLDRGLREAVFHPGEQGVACRVGDLDQAAGEVEQQDQEADARREERDQVVAGPEGGQADDPEGSEHGAHEAAEAADHDD